MITFQQCLEKAKSAKPDLYPIWYIEVEGNYYFNMLKRGIDVSEAPSSIFMVNSKNGKVSGSIPVMWLYGNPDLKEKLKNPHKISGADQMVVSHAADLQGSGFQIRMDGEELAHYGIKGQKWGVRRFQNEDMSLTPAGRERYGIGSSEGNGGKKSKFQQASEDAKAERAQSAAIKKKADELYEKNVAKHNPGFFERKEYRLAADKEAWLDYIETPTEYNEEKRSQTKKADAKSTVTTHAIYTAISPVNAIYLIADGIQTLMANKREKAYMKYREENSVYDKKTGLYKKTEGSYDEKADLSAVNPRYVDINSNSKSNCMLCTTTYEMRQRGWDVTAQFDSRGYTFGDLKRWFPKAKMERNGRFDADGKVIKQKQYVQNTINNLLKQGEGARGNLMVSWMGGGGHSMFYEVKNGKLVIKCGQSNTVFEPEYILGMTDANCYARLDNIPMDINRIKAECCR